MCQPRGGQTDGHAATITQPFTRSTSKPIIGVEETIIGKRVVVLHPSWLPGVPFFGLYVEWDAILFHLLHIATPENRSLRAILALGSRRVFPSRGFLGRYSLPRFASFAALKARGTVPKCRCPDIPPRSRTDVIALRKRRECLRGKQVASIRTISFHAEIDCHARALVSAN